MKKAIALLSSVPLSLAVAVQVHAQDYLDDVGSASGLSATDNLPELIGKLINVLISVLGIVFLGLTLYAGLIWMTAGGDEGKVDKAKKLLINGVVGLVLVLAALAISNFVFTSLETAGLGM